MTKNNKENNSTSFLNQEELNTIALAKSRRNIDKQNKELENAKDYLESKTTSGKIKSFITQKPTTKIKNISWGRPQLPNYSKEQILLQEMFSGNNNYLTGQNLPKINGVLIKGGGLIKNGDRGETRGLFLR